MNKVQRYLTISLLIVPLLTAACKPIQPPTPTPGRQSATATPAPAATAMVTDDSAAKGLLEEGNEYFNAGDYENAIASFTESIQHNPDLAAAYVRRAAAYLRIRDFEAAIPDCDAAIRLNPTDADAYLYRGISYSYLGDFDQAIADLTEAIRLNNGSVDAHVYRGASYYFAKHYAASVQDCTEAVRLSGGYFLPAEICINVMGKLASPDFEDLEAAIEDYDAAIDLDPDAAAAYLFRGLAKRSLGEIEAAVMDLEEALRLDPFLSDLLLMYWSIAYANPFDPSFTVEDPEAAIEDLEFALSLVEPDSVLAVIIESSLTQLRAEQ
jgi:tetratricopeptide (TPR) repeat protein